MVKEQSEETMDKIIKTLAFNKTIRIYGISATQTVSEIKRRTHATREVTAALGRLAMGTAMLGAMESFDAKIYTKVDGGGPVGIINADADAYGNVRAYAENPLVQLPANAKGKLDIAGIVGNNGFLYVIKDLGLRDLFTSQTALVSGELGIDFAQYFAESQQTPSAVGLGVLTDDAKVKVAGGFIAQVLPDTPDEHITTLEENIAKIPSILNFLQEHTIYDLLAFLSNDTMEILEEIPVQFHCSCSKERFLDAFATLPKAELQEMLADAHDEEVVCRYCGEKYYISNDDLQQILSQS